ncbi:glucan endo-1,3-beta-glucosidase 8-like [Phalaenopsis equestris]|uniref:glucan endo-1,3-beta-glucosidase 8-like n=1 Tax=Phalaenopsis equestris TaxID=78828 RepID=UPI0009E1B3B1|nr:glucan endo-1,3-beta-glucosidase 8-like [Phalaenopsis equestris]
MPPPSILVHIFAAISLASATQIGVNWGTQTSHPLNPNIVVKLLQDNDISKVKLFDPDPWTLSTLSGTGIDVMIGIPNEQLLPISKHYDTARDWVKQNITNYLHSGGLKISYVAVGNEPFLTSYNGAYLQYTFPALKNIQKALNEAGVGHRIKAVVPQNADVYGSDSGLPSGGAFRSDIRGLMTQIALFLKSNGAPFVVNIYPFLSLYQNSHFPVNFAFFDGGGRDINDGGRLYGNVFDASFDTLVFALNKIGIDGMKIIVGEVGWPTDGAERADEENAKRFYDGFMKKMGRNRGTPMRQGPLEVYLFSLIDEDMKSITPGNFERHWGLFTYDGRQKFDVDLRGKGKKMMGAKGVEYQEAKWCVVKEEANNLRLVAGNMDYACSLGDCTPLAYGGSCNGLGDWRGNASYAFNVYFQTQDQDVRACDFEGLAEITRKNASRKGCLFPVQIVSEGERVVVVEMLAVVAVAAVSLMGL